MSYGARERVVLKQFEGDIADHHMTVIRNEGNYRHLRFSPPDSYVMGFDIITWPGYLAYVGDMGSYVFSRTEDMLTFFRREDDYPIDFRYWAEKLQGPRGSRELAVEYSATAMQEEVERWLKDYVEGHELGGTEALELREAVQEQVLDREMANESETFAYYYIREFDHNGISMEGIEEPNFKQYEFRFLWCCFALVWAIEQYDKSDKPVVPVRLTLDQQTAIGEVASVARRIAASYEVYGGVAIGEALEVVDAIGIETDHVEEP